MVKRVLTSIVTLTVLMGSLVACSGSDSELAELRAELEELKEEKNQEATEETEETEITNDASESVPDDASESVPDDASEPSQASSEEPNSTFDDPCEAATTAKSEEEFRTLAQLCVDQSDYEPTGRLLFEAQCVGIFGDDNNCGGLSQWIIDTGDVLEEGGYTLDKRCFSNAIIEMLQINGSLNNREDEVELAVRLCVIGDFPATNQQSSPAPTPTPRPTTSQPPPSQQGPAPTPTPIPPTPTPTPTPTPLVNPFDRCEVLVTPSGSNDYDTDTWSFHVRIRVRYSPTGEGSPYRRLGGDGMLLISYRSEAGNGNEFSGRQDVYATDAIGDLPNYDWVETEWSGGFQAELLSTNWLASGYRRDLWEPGDRIFIELTPHIITYHWGAISADTGEDEYSSLQCVYENYYITLPAP